MTAEEVNKLVDTHGEEIYVEQVINLYAQNGFQRVR